MTPDAAPLRKPLADPVAALAEALRSYSPCALSVCNHLLLGYCEHDAASIAFALAAAGFAVAPKLSPAPCGNMGASPYTTDQGAICTTHNMKLRECRQRAEIARLRAALEEIAGDEFSFESDFAPMRYVIDIARAALAGGSDGD